MVVKTELCAFSETRVYPGHGSRFVTRTGQVVILASSKVTSLFHQKKKPAKLYWTQASRKLHKKSNVESAARKKARRVVKVQRGYIGAEKIDEIRKRNAAGRPAATAAPRTKSGAVIQAAVADAKTRQKEASKARKVTGAATQKSAAPAKHSGKGR